MKHYICTGECQGVSDHPGTCQSKECSLHNQPLIECNCEDGKHQEVKNDYKTTTSFLKNQQVSVLSILQSDNSIHSATLHFANSEDSLIFYFMTDKTSRKCRSLLTGSKQNASLVIGFSEEDFTTFQAEGEIGIAKDHEFSDGSTTYTTKFPDRKSWLEKENIVILQFTPTWWRYSDTKTSSPVKISTE